MGVVPHAGHAGDGIERPLRSRFQPRLHAQHAAGHARTSYTKVVQGARHALATLLQDVGVNHGRGTIVVPAQLLNGADVRTALEQVSGEGMAKGVGAEGVRQTGMVDRHLDGLVEEAGVNMMATGDARTRVNGEIPGRKDIEPEPHALAACGDVRASAWGR